jgi:hypothetical protein
LAAGSTGVDVLKSTADGNGLQLAHVSELSKLAKADGRLLSAVPFGDLWLEA